MVEQGWYRQAQRLISSNCNRRPDNTEVSLLVIHNISLPPGEYGNGCVERFFQNQLPAGEHPYFSTISNLHVSSHCFIRRNGEVVQFVPFSKRAWHAGESCFDGDENCNDYSIGIELEGTDSEPYAEQQYHSLAALTKSIIHQYPKITKERITGHSDIAPDRKTDPGPSFDWNHYRSLLELS
ncbi:1,6-anhydro-N-acetylmuramyl-L-alanine amidase AmpD [Teredinibacter haidensis]|uniref:1,6-anhydro-N-acetylmuramyl-L-alanine amidase AmpD n=1 Tax=Teredinibacter haidensis TaxID=2731755 RepID=UPI000948AF8C|nr:1,6-anhydro-N-acetylmuramyl-L-alanine amidase AmpD [Teredinibacter haidensis]